jgi:hypothetical protein
MSVEKCPVCYGSGKYDKRGYGLEPDKVTCHGCLGKGWVETSNQSFTPYFNPYFHGYSSHYPNGCSGYCSGQCPYYYTQCPYKPK